jgi:DNA-binding NarL/FixJ family response regulator
VPLFAVPLTGNQTLVCTYQNGGEASLHAAALRANATAIPTSDPSGFWSALIERPDDFRGSGVDARRRYVLVRASPDGVPKANAFLPVQASVLALILCGVQGKATADELGMAASTVSKWYTRSLRRLGVSSQTLPLPLVLAAQSWACKVPLPIDTREARFEEGGERFKVLSAPSPSLDRCRFLSTAEREVAGRFLEGDPPLQIARDRGTAPETVAGQLRAIYAKCRASGRFALVRRAVDLGWFA